MDMTGVRNHIDLLMKVFGVHREDANVIKTAKILAEELGINLTTPRRCAP